MPHCFTILNLEAIWYFICLKFGGLDIYLQYTVLV